MASPPSDSSSAPTFWRLHGGKLVVSAVITVVFVYMLRSGGLKLIPEGGNFSRVRWWTLPAYLVTLIGVSYFRASRWRFLLRPIADVPTKKLVAVSWIGFAAILILPLRIGELVRPYMLRTPGKTDASGRTVGAITMTAATGSVVAERMLDGLFLSIVLLTALLTVPTIDPLPKTVAGLHISVAQVRDAGFMMPVVFAVGFAVVVVYYVARNFARRATFAVFGLVSKKLAERLAGMAENLADGLHFLGKPRYALPFLGETAIYWGLNALGMWLLAWGSGVMHADGTGITFGEACGLMGMLGISILIPGPPGALGPFQLGIYAGMTMYFPTEVVLNEGAAYVFLIYIVQLGWTMLGAATFLVLDPRNWRALEEAEGILPPSPEGPPADEKLAAPSAAR